jgi:hypothetical protein
MNPKYLKMASDHWTKHRPKTVEKLRKQGVLAEALQLAAKQATERVVELMQQGFRHHEAEEVARAEFLILPPDQSEWEGDEELTQREQQYQESMREPPETTQTA